MQVGTISKRTIIRRTAVMLLCGAAGWYLKAKLTPQMPMMGMNMGDPRPLSAVEILTCSPLMLTMVAPGYVRPLYDDS